MGWEFYDTLRTHSDCSPMFAPRRPLFVDVSENALVSELVSIGGFVEVLKKQQHAQLVEVVGDEIGGGCENRTHDRSFAG
jgi:hypothetical protein